MVGLPLGLGDFGDRLGGVAADGGDVMEAEEFAVRVLSSHYTLGNSVKCSLKVMESAYCSWNGASGQARAMIDSSVSGHGAVNVKPAEMCSAPV